VISDDDLLLEFAGNPEALAEAREALEKFGDAYRYQLVAAIHLNHQAAYLEELRAGGQLERAHSPDYWTGYTEALRHISEGRRDGGYPGGPHFDDTIEGRAF
jgi:hypothetical protein